MKGLCSELARTYQVLHRGTFKTGLSLNALPLHTECVLSPIRMHRFKTNLTWASCMHSIFLELTRISTRLPKLLLPVNKKHIPKAHKKCSGIRPWSICLCMKLKARTSIKRVSQRFLKIREKSFSGPFPKKPSSQMVTSDLFYNDKL